MSQRFADDDLVGRARGRITSGHDPRPGDIAKHDVVGGSARREERAVSELDRRGVDQRGRLHAWKRPHICDRRGSKLPEEDQHVVRARRLGEPIEGARRPAGAGEGSQHDRACDTDDDGQDEHLTPPPRQAPSEHTSRPPPSAHSATPRADAKEAGTHHEVVLAHGPPRHPYTVKSAGPRADLRFRRVLIWWRRWDSNPRPPACKPGPSTTPKRLGPPCREPVVTVTQGGTGHVVVPGAAIQVAPTGTSADGPPSPHPVAR